MCSILQWCVCVLFFFFERQAICWTNGIVNDAKLFIWMYKRMNASIHFAMNLKVLFESNLRSKPINYPTKEHLITTISTNWIRHTTKQITCYWFKLNSLATIIIHRSSSNNNSNKKKREQTKSALLMKKLCYYWIECGISAVISFSHHC